MDWSLELMQSLIWLGKAFVASLFGLACASVVLGRYTSWGRQIRRLTVDFFKPSHSILPLIWLALIVFMTLFVVRLNVLMSFWFNGFYSAMQNLDAKAFWLMVLVFASLASILVVHALLNSYLQQAFFKEYPPRAAEIPCDTFAGFKFHGQLASVTRLPALLRFFHGLSSGAWLRYSVAITRAVHFKLDYVNAGGDISNYYPDFMVKLSDKRIVIVETKGQGDLDVPLKMARLRQWCEDINRVQTAVEYDFVYVDEESFEKYKPTSFRQLLEAFKE